MQQQYHKLLPKNMLEHPLSYTIITSDSCQNLVANLEHPLVQRFGYSPVLPSAHLHSVTLLSPITFRVQSGYNYFLIHRPKDAPMPNMARTHRSGDAGVPDAVVPEEKQRKGHFKRGSTLAPSGHGHHTLTSKRTSMVRTSAAEMPAEARKSMLFTKRLSTLADVEGASSNAPAKGLPLVSTDQVVPELQAQLRTSLEPHCQDAGGETHFDISVREGKYVVRLQQRQDFPELFEGLIRFAEEDIGGRVELFLRYPRAGTECAPQKICEWLICVTECYPIGF